MKTVNKDVVFRFLSPTNLVASIGASNTVLSPGAVLISGDVSVGNGNVFYPNVVIENKSGGTIMIGDNNTFYPGVYVMSAASTITIGDGNEFGPAGVTIRANTAEADITIGDNGRYCDGVSIIGKTNLGSGSQILGNITAQSCSLGAGGTFQEPDPDKRGAVLKGFGLARGITLTVGQVVNGAGNFADVPVEWQHAYHPKNNVLKVERRAV